MLAKRDEVRNQFASLFGASTQEIGFLYSTSEGENIVSHALHLKPGDNVVLDDLHYTTTYVLYDTLAKKLGFEVRIVPSVEGRADPEHFEPYVNDRTRLVSVSWVSHQNGFRHDLKGLSALAHAHGAYLYADSIQALGMFPTNLHDEGVDFATSGTYKWLLGSFGVAAFYVREEHLDLIEADRLGFLAIKEEKSVHDFVLYDDARKYEYSTLAFGPIYQLGASLEYLKGVGLDRIERHTVALAHRMRDALRERGYKVRTPAENGSSIVAFWHGKDPQAAQTMFDVANVKVSFREGGTQIRAGAALFNNESDVDRFLEVVDRLSE
jgi:selenocysteine lyase/cysteine desulfurase